MRISGCSKIWIYIFSLAKLQIFLILIFLCNFFHTSPSKHWNRPLQDLIIYRPDTSFRQDSSVRSLQEPINMLRLDSVSFARSRISSVKRWIVSDPMKSSWPHSVRKNHGRRQIAGILWISSSSFLEQKVVNTPWIPHTKSLSRHLSESFSSRTRTSRTLRSIRYSGNSEMKNVQNHDSFEGVNSWWKMPTRSTGRKKSLMLTSKSCIKHMIEYSSDSVSQIRRIILLLLDEISRSTHMSSRRSSVSEKTRYISVRNAGRHIIKKSSIQRISSVPCARIPSVIRRSSQKSVIFLSLEHVFQMYLDSNIRIAKGKTILSLWDAME